MTKNSSQYGTVFLQNLMAILHEYGLTIMGQVPDDGENQGKNLLLIGPDGGKLWPVFCLSPEYKAYNHHDMTGGKPNRHDQLGPLDRWTLRIFDEIQARLPEIAAVYFPFTGPPYNPFRQWAVASGQCFISPTGLLVHSRFGLWVSFRAAIVIDCELTRLADMQGLTPAANPCLSCVDQPCLSACPVNAISIEQGYNVKACITQLHHDHAHETGCDEGCLIRKSCPAGPVLQPVAQRQFHLKSFEDSAVQS